MEKHWLRVKLNGQLGWVLRSTFRAITKSPSGLSSKPKLSTAPKPIVKLQPTTKPPMTAFKKQKLVISEDILPIANDEQSVAVRTPVQKRRYQVNLKPDEDQRLFFSTFDKMRFNEIYKSNDMRPFKHRACPENILHQIKQ